MRQMQSVPQQLTETILRTRLMSRVSFAAGYKLTVKISTMRPLLPGLLRHDHVTSYCLISIWSFCVWDQGVSPSKRVILQYVSFCTVLIIQNNKSTVKTE